MTNPETTWLRYAAGKTRSDITKYCLNIASWCLLKQAATAFSPTKGLQMKMLRRIEKIIFLPNLKCLKNS
jgi:hypothetical protein